MKEILFFLAILPFLIVGLAVFDVISGAFMK